MNKSWYIDTLLHNAITYSRDKRGLLKSSHAAGLKLMEEVGEFAEAILVEDGLLPHKGPLKESSIGEAADIILMVMQVLSNHYPELYSEVIVKQLKEQIQLKLIKWNDKVLSFKKPLTDNIIEYQYSDIILQPGDKFVGSGICDGCGHSAPDLILLAPNRMSAGLCSCFNCYTGGKYE